jgi:hypothetical protein
MRIARLFAIYVSSQILSAVSHGAGYLEQHDPARLGQTTLGGDDFIDIVKGSQFVGLGTFANLPYVNCLSTSKDEDGRYDIAILGAPFDTVCNKGSAP